MRHSEGFTIGFLLKTIAKNLQYIFLVLGTLNLLNIINFNLNPKHFPSLSISSEIAKITGYTYNPIFIYGHYIYTFLLIAKGFALGFFETIQANYLLALITCILIVNIWLLYNKVSFSYGKSIWKLEGILSKLTKSIWEESNILEKGLWMIFFIDIMTIITSPGKYDLLFLLVIYLLMIAVKFFPNISYTIINLSDNLERTFLYDKRVLLAITGIDIVLIYFDSSSIFTLFLITLVYNGIALLILNFLKRFRELYDYVFYVFNLGILVFFLSMMFVYWIALLAVLLMQSPVIAFYYYKYKRFISENWIELINGIVLVILIIRFF
ncbi:MAG: hypothetical protein PHD81_03200 [Candidatus Nanoarchaeia archaeon]|nr:hypothetical protein [Candidatus Nanoarchaeia archaeon]MDD5588091.1 hypothetical protein [Candidatus Nanoarchaeia archaeon]